MNEDESTGHRTSILLTVFPPELGNKVMRFGGGGVATVMEGHAPRGRSVAPPLKAATPVHSVCLG